MARSGSPLILPLADVMSTKDLKLGFCVRGAVYNRYQRGPTSMAYYSQATSCPEIQSWKWRYGMMFQIITAYNLPIQQTADHKFVVLHIASASAAFGYYHSVHTLIFICLSVG